MNRGLWIGLVLAGAPFFLQNASSPNIVTDAPRILAATSHVKFEVPMFGSVGKTACDASGRMYFNVGAQIGQMGPFLGISADGRSHAVYALPSQLSAFADLAWAVTPGGTFYVLRGNSKGHSLVRFRDDGSVDSISSVDIPGRTSLRFFAITDRGALYVQGYHIAQDPLKEPSRSFAGLFDASGKLVRDLSDRAPHVDLAAAQFGPIDGDVAAGEDGQFYLLDTKRVIVLNAAGEVEKELAFEIPSEDARAVRVDYSKGNVSIIFHSVHRISPSEPANVTVRALILNAQTGEPRGRFAFDPNTTGSVLCFDAQEGYSLMAVDGKMAAKDVVAIR